MKKFRKTKKILKIFIFAIAFMLIAISGVILYIKMSPRLEIKSANAFLMYDNTNELFFQGSGSQEWVSLDNISENVIMATINTEDQHFYSHHGFDILRILKARSEERRVGKECL